MGSLTWACAGATCIGTGCLLVPIGSRCKAPLGETRACLGGGRDSSRNKSPPHAK
ncbi:hypothetical protein BC940DRAFT_311694 [Gongronella butleri]|nr:hypothetical protein BC940DRAFT_311694 [Gongronella butleri]